MSRTIKITLATLAERRKRNDMLSKRHISEYMLFLSSENGDRGVFLGVHESFDSVDCDFADIFRFVFLCQSLL